MKSVKSFSYTLLALAFILLDVPLYNWWCGTGIGKLLGGITPSYLNDGVALVLCIIGIVLGFLLPRRLSEEGNKWGRIISCSLLFILIVQSFSFSDNFVHSMAVPWIRYTDVLFPFLIVFIITSFCVCHSSRNRTSKEQKTEIERGANLYCDDASEKDFLGRTRLVQHLCAQLTSSEPNKSGALGVAITGGWGTGKSWFLLQLSEQLKAKGGICIDFKPWLMEEKRSRFISKLLKRKWRP